jgi:hypothetical protein
LSIKIRKSDRQYPGAGVFAIVKITEQGVTRKMLDLPENLPKGKYELFIGSRSDSLHLDLEDDD